MFTNETKPRHFIIKMEYEGNQGAETSKSEAAATDSRTTVAIDCGFDHTYLRSIEGILRVISLVSTSIDLKYEFKIYTCTIDLSYLRSMVQVSVINYILSTSQSIAHCRAVLHFTCRWRLCWRLVVWYTCGHRMDHVLCHCDCH